MKDRIALALHGGAGAKAGRDYARAEAHMRALVEEGRTMLEAERPALDVVEEMVAELEASGLYTAGKGSHPNTAGYAELDASIMVGENTSSPRRAGAVAAVGNLRFPVRAARRVMDETPHILLAGQGAADFCREQGLDFVDNPDTYYTLPVGVKREDLAAIDGLSHGTVGAVARDVTGRLAAATSTGGVFGKLAGRVGDTPLIGSGTWADGVVAASCTGIGEAFILAGGAQDLASRVRYNNADLDTASKGLIDDVAAQGGDGGVIAVDKDGRLAFHWNSDGMKRAGFGPGVEPFAETF